MANMGGTYVTIQTPAALVQTRDGDGAGCNHHILEGSPRRIPVKRSLNVNCYQRQDKVA